MSVTDQGHPIPAGSFIGLPLAESLQHFVSLAFGAILVFFEFLHPSLSALTQILPPELLVYIVGEGKLELLAFLAEIADSAEGLELVVHRRLIVGGELSVCAHVAQEKLVYRKT